MHDRQEVDAQGDATPTDNNKRRRTAYVNAGGGRKSRVCPHCERVFKRTEHLERHVRTHTKEKPFGCSCGLFFSRRDLLRRHQRVAAHDGCGDSTAGTSSDVQQISRPGPGPAPLPGPVAFTDGEAARPNDFARTAPLSGLDLPVDPWITQQHSLPSNDNGSNDIFASSSTNIDRLVPASTHMYGSEGVGFDEYFRDFANFLDGVGLPAEWSPFFEGPDRREADVPNANPIPLESTPSPESTSSRSRLPGPKTGATTPFSSWLPSAPPPGNRISNGTIDSSYTQPIDGGGGEAQPFKVTEEQRGALAEAVEAHSHILVSPLRLPSRHALTRYLSSFFEGFHSHMPFMHGPTWRLLDNSLELILAISAIGAQYCFESKASHGLFLAGKAIVMDKVSRETERSGPGVLSTTPQQIGSDVLAGGRGNDDHDDDDEDDPHMTAIDTVRTLVALMGFATWEPDAHMVHEAFNLQAALVKLLRYTGGLNDPEQLPSFHVESAGNTDLTPETQWRIWVRREAYRRSKLIAFSFLHTHSIAYDVYPVLRSNEVHLRLPCSTKEWKAANPTQWLAARRETPREQLYYQEALSLLLQNKSSSPCALSPIPTPLGNYVLLHGLLQRIHIVRDLSLPMSSSTASLPREEVEKLERGLRSWTSGWQQAPESSLDPNNENGPIPFTSSSLLALAYIRIYLHLGPYRRLDTRDPQCIALALAHAPAVKRSEGIITALLYATHMLSIPIRLGVDRVARSQAFFWSVRHSLASLECCIFLSKWLSNLGSTSTNSPADDSEDRILYWIRCIVEEAYDVVDFVGDEEPEELTDFQNPKNLGLAVLRIGAHFFKSNTQWPFINIIGTSLERYRQHVRAAEHPG